MDMGAWYEKWMDLAAYFECAHAQATRNRCKVARLLLIMTAFVKNTGRLTGDAVQYFKYSLHYFSIVSLLSGLRRLTCNLSRTRPGIF